MPCGLCHQAVHVELNGFCVFHHLRDWFVWVLNGHVGHLYPWSQLLFVFRAVFRALLHVTYISTPGVSNVLFICSGEVFRRQCTVII
jgi:hypothetical protein